MESRNTDFRMGSADPAKLSLTPTDTDGILVIGLYVGNRFFSTGRTQIGGMQFQSLDLATRRLIPETRGGHSIMLNRGGSIFNKDFSAEKGGYRYLVQRLPAGAYYMTNVFWGPNGNGVMSEGSIAVDVKPGVVTYIGNVSFKVPFFVFQDVKFKPRDREDAFVSRIMANYKNVTSPISHQRMSVYKLSCDLKQGIGACY